MSTYWLVTIITPHEGGEYRTSYLECGTERKVRDKYHKMITTDEKLSLVNVPDYIVDKMIHDLEKTALS